MRGSRPFSIAVLISGSGTNLQALIDAIAEERIPARIDCVISNRPAAGGLARAERAGIATVVVDHRQFADRAAYDAALAEQLERRSPDLVVLAGFMRILTDAFVRRFMGRLINIHPSLLPAYRGLHTHERVLEAGDRHHGCSVHYVTPELDAGPVIARAVVAVQPGDRAADLQSRVQAAEHRLYPQVVAWLAQGRVRLQSGHVQFDGRPVTSPLQLDAEPVS